MSMTRIHKRVIHPRVVLTLDTVDTGKLAGV